MLFCVSYLAMIRFILLLTTLLLLSGCIPFVPIVQDGEAPASSTGQLASANFQELAQD